MRKFSKKTKLAAALAVALAAGGLGGAHAAVQLATEGLGDAAIIPYYTVKRDPAPGGAAWQTFIRLYNASDNAIAVKVRFREAENSREVLNFVVWLSPWDAWNAWTDPNADGQGNPGIRTNDVSCTTPNKTGDNWRVVVPAQNGNPAVRYELFKDAAYSGLYADGGTSGIRRASEGHIEVIGIAQWAPGTQTAEDVTHRQDGTPACALVDRFSLGRTPAAEAFDTAEDMRNVLAVNTYLIRIATGQAVGVPATMLADFTRGRAGGPGRGAARRLINELVSDDQKPDLDSADPFSRVVYLDPDFVPMEGLLDYWTTEPDENWNLNWLAEPALNTNGTRVQSRLVPAVGDPPVNGPPSGTPGWVHPWVRGGVDAVSAVITRAQVINEWGRRTDGGVISEIATQWVLTFPTKHYYVDIQNDPIPTLAPFNQDNIYPTLKGSLVAGRTVPVAYDPFAERFQFTGLSCNQFRATLYDYEENFRVFTSPAPTTIPGLCYETNVVSFGNTKDGLGRDVGLTSDVGIEIGEDLFPSANATEGWAIFDLRTSPSAGGIPGGLARGLRGTEAQGFGAPTEYVYYGLPVVGFQITNYQVAAVGGDNFSTAHDHKYIRDIQPTEPNGNGSIDP